MVSELSKLSTQTIDSVLVSAKTMADITESIDDVKESFLTLSAILFFIYLIYFNKNKIKTRFYKYIH